MKNLKKPSDIYNNNKYSTTISRSFTINWISLLFFAILFSPFIVPILLKANHIILLSIINSFDISICILIIVCCIIQMTIKIKIFILKAYIPDFPFNDDANKTKDDLSLGLIYIIFYLFILIVQIYFLVYDILRCKKELLKRKSLGEIKPLNLKNETKEKTFLEKENNNAPETPQPSDYWISNIKN